MAEDAPKKLTDKQQRFVEEYCVDFNATQAAKRAGYSVDTSFSIGSENLRKPLIAAAIKKRLDELAMSADEALKRLGDIARGTVGHFINANDDGDVYINLGAEDAVDNYNLLRKVKQTKTTTKGEGEYEREEVRTEFELYDAKGAIIDILKMHGKFVDRVDVTTAGEKIPSTFNINIHKDEPDS